MAVGPAAVVPEGGLFHGLEGAFHTLDFVGAADGHGVRIPGHVVGDTPTLLVQLEKVFCSPFACDLEKKWHV